MLAGTAELPFAKGDRILGGWQVNANATVMSGLPFNVSYRDAGADRDTGPGRPNLIGDPQTGSGNGLDEPVLQRDSHRRPPAARSDGRRGERSATCRGTSCAAPASGTWTRRCSSGSGSGSRATSSSASRRRTCSTTSTTATPNAKIGVPGNLNPAAGFITGTAPNWNPRNVQFAPEVRVLIALIDRATSAGRRPAPPCRFLFHVVPRRPPRLRAFAVSTASPPIVAAVLASLALSGPGESARRRRAAAATDLGPPPREGHRRHLASLDDPARRSVAAATHMRDEDLVLGLVLSGEARAYPWWIAKNHHVVNDTVAGVPITVAFCEQCTGGAAFRRKVDGRVSPSPSPASTTARSSSATARREALWAPFSGKGHRRAR